ncbi:MAG: hypothetical protein HY774_08135 [Acidobacteria bacterium]|nr:hypothetical protein [Acidobacteriota bacterium]
MLTKLQQVAALQRNIYLSRKNVDLLVLDNALQRLETFDPRQVQLVELQYFAGLKTDETAEVLGISLATVGREWSMAKA